MNWWMDTEWDDEEFDMAAHRAAHSRTLNLSLTYDQLNILRVSLRVSRHEGALSKEEVAPILEIVERTLENR
jgi:hypothetical protein